LKDDTGLHDAYNDMKHKVSFLLEVALAEQEHDIDTLRHEDISIGFHVMVRDAQDELKAFGERLKGVHV